MKISLPVMLVSTFLISCSHHQDESQVPSIEQKGYIENSITSEIIDIPLVPKIREPFLIREIDRLEFTSGVDKSVIDSDFCDSLSKGFWGRYFLIDPNYADEKGRPVGGTITVRVHDELNSWQANDTTQTVWRINLKSDVISVWGSIHVGLTRTEIEDFSQLNKGLCLRKGDVYYSCDFNSFSAVYIFQNDTLKELTVTRKCVNRKKN